MTAAGSGWAPAPALRGRLAKLGIARQADLLLHLPLRYEDETRITPVTEAPWGSAAQFEVQVQEASVHYRPRRQLVVQTEDASGAPLVLRFLNFYGSQRKQFAEGAWLRVFGEARNGFFGAELVHPRVRVVRPGEPLAATLTPVYPTCAGLSQNALRRQINQALADCPVVDPLPNALRQRLGLCTLGQAIRVLHQPGRPDEAVELVAGRHPAWQRIRFDELLAQQLSLRQAHDARRARRGVALADTSLTGRLLAQLPFALTVAQQRVLDEVLADMASPHPMQRLVQGDVGSGKTAVAALACAQAIGSGVQAAFMAPTEILAGQHGERLRGWFEAIGVRVAFLSGSLGARARREALAAIASGEVSLVIGTHALIESAVAFCRLGLVVVDEQHRFGVQQRLDLQGKGGYPHVLMMSATPIPRSLAMTYYADLDVSVIDALPPGRQAVKTKLVADNRRDEVVGAIRGVLAEGRQVYWVCPLIDGENSEGGVAKATAKTLRAAIDTHADLAAALPEVTVGLMHGRLPTADKSTVMDDFVAGRIQVLVATTVVEVGVDVPNASLMVIEHAERFGLAQLHQLRGRVGRGAAAAVCVLLYSPPLSENGRARLRTLYETNDGFEIARRDLALRGPGEFIGSRQSGVPLLRFADLERDRLLVEQAQSVAGEMLRDTPELAEAFVDQWLGARRALLDA